ncbi:HNH endonuclease [Streptomyces sp. SS1-1]|nr:HNH endonuclease [Streptomyces sp. SS1-1]
MKLGGRYQMAHRVAYQEIVGPIPEGLQLDHLCRVRHCVNPAHLEPVTSRENTLRGENLVAINAAKTHCKRGHLFDAANTYRWRNSRICRECRRLRSATKAGDRS